jgi:hypothetical protein
VPVVRTRRPTPGRHHPASAADVRDALRRFGPTAYYGVDSVELVPSPRDDACLHLGRFVMPARIELFDQARSPWRLGFELAEGDAEWLAEGGAAIERGGVVVWPDGSLRRFMLGWVLPHELGHHVVQHERRLRGERAIRTAEHEARARSIAAELRRRLD